MKKFLLCLFMFFIFTVDAGANELSELKSMMKDMQQQMNQMAERIKELEEQKQAREMSDNRQINQLRTRVDEIEQSKTRESSGILSTLNPEVSVIGDFIYKADENGGEGDNDFNMREVELAFSANVDTWARGDVIVAIENEDGTEVALEEAYLTLLETPVENLQAKLGKFRPFIGKANTMHLHQLPWSDYPLVVQNFLGEEGLSEHGVALSYLIPNPADVYSELTIGGFNSGSTVLGGDENNETVYMAHWKNFFDLSDDTTLELGGSFLTGENGNASSSKAFLSGFDITLNTELFDGKRTTSHTEVLFNTSEQFGGDDINSWGMFTSLEQQLADRWWAFGRYDFSQTPTSSAVDTQAYSAGLTFAQSEYVFWRTMFTHTDNENTDDDNTLWLQLNFSIGPHKPHNYR